MSNPIQQIITSSLNRLGELNLTINSARWEEASILYDLRHLPWHHTEYGTWTVFRDSCIDQAPQTVYKKIRAHENAMELGYTSKELVSLSEKFTFSSLMFYFASIDEKVGIRELKKMSNADMIAAASTHPNVHTNMYNLLSFSLTQDHADKLMGILEQYGAYVVPSGRKIGISDAMERWLDTM